MFSGSMADTLTTKERSARMSLIRGRDTGPEWKVRRLVHGLGYRYRLHGAGLPGKPDLVFSKRRCVIFVHGCFWHQHPSRRCKLSRMPKSRLEFWKPKLERNAERDRENLTALKAAGWRSLVIWECELRQPATVVDRIEALLRA